MGLPPCWQAERVEDPSAGPDLSGLQPSCQAAVGRGLRWVFIVAFSLIGIATVLRLIDDPDGIEIVFSLMQLACYGYMVIFYLVRPRQSL